MLLTNQPPFQPVWRTIGHPRLKKPAIEALSAPIGAVERENQPEGRHRARKEAAQTVPLLGPGDLWNFRFKRQLWN